MNRKPMLAALLASAAVVTLAVIPGPPGARADQPDTEGGYEVWMVDQSDTTPQGGGRLFIYDGASLNGRSAHKAVPEVIDLGGEAQSLTLTTGSAGRRPHMMFFNAASTHAILSYVTTGHVLFIDGATRKPVGVVDVGLQSHSAFPSPDSKFVLVANQNGKLLQRINTDYATNTYTLDADAELDLANGTTPSGALRQDPLLRPDNAPICLGIDASSRYGFITLRGGGLFVVDCTTKPMKIVAEYDKATIHPTGCVAIQVGGKMYIISGTGAEAHADLYVLPMDGFSPTPAPPNLPAPGWVLSEDGGRVDAHGAIPTKHGKYLWMADRFDNKITVVDSTTDRVVSRFSMVGNGLSSDPAPDLMEISPSGNRIFATLRGPRPLTGNNPGLNNAVGSTPGLAIFRVTGGWRERPVRVHRPYHPRGGRVRQFRRHRARRSTRHRRSPKIKRPARPLQPLSVRPCYRWKRKKRGRGASLSRALPISGRRYTRHHVPRSTFDREAGDWQRFVRFRLRHPLSWHDYCQDWQLKKIN